MKQEDSKFEASLSSKITNMKTNLKQALRDEKQKKKIQQTSKAMLSHRAGTRPVTAVKCT